MPTAQGNKDRIIQLCDAHDWEFELDNPDRGKLDLSSLDENEHAHLFEEIIDEGYSPQQCTEQVLKRHLGMAPLIYDEMSDQMKNRRFNTKTENNPKIKELFWTNPASKIKANHERIEELCENQQYF